MRTPRMMGLVLVAGLAVLLTGCQEQQRKISMLEEENADLRARCDAMAQTLASLNTELKETRQDAERANAIAEKLEQRVEQELKAEIVAGLNQQIEGVQQKVTAKSTSVDAALAEKTQRLDQLVAQLDAVKSAQAERTEQTLARVARLEEAMERLSKQLSGAIAELQSQTDAAATEATGGE